MIQELIMAVIGVSGAFLTTFLYWMMTSERMSANSLRFYGLNALGAFMIMVSVIYNFDWGDLGGFVMELSWLIVSIMGIVKVLTAKRKPERDEVF